MAGPYQRLEDGQSADVGAQALPAVVNAMQGGLEDVEAALTGKASTGHTHVQADVTGLGVALAAKSDAGHGHTQADVTGLGAALADKAAAAHVHTQSDVSGLGAALAAKSDTGHTHTGVYDTAGSAASAQAAAVQRDNHTGTQLAATISDFDTRVRASRLDQMAAPTSPVALGGQKITGLGTPTASTDAVTKAYADSLSGGGATLIGGAILVATANGVTIDGKHIIATVSGTTITATSSGAHTAPYFTNDYIGKSIWLDNGSSVFKTTITAVSSGTVATIAASPGPGSYGAVFGTDNTSTINALLAGMTKGQHLVLPASDLFILTEGGHVVSTESVGVEGTDRHYTQFVVPHRTNSLFRVSSHWGKFAEFSAIHAGVYTSIAGSLPAYPTAGAAFRQDDLGVNDYLEVRYDHILGQGFYNNWHFVSGWAAILDDCGNDRPVADGIVIDNPNIDQVNVYIKRCGHFSMAGVYAGIGGANIKWLGGGNVEITNNAFGRGGNNILLALTPNAADPGKNFSTNVRISDNSFEDPTIACVGIAPAAGVSWQSMVISGNTMNSTLGGRAIYGTGFNASIQNFAITGNTSSVNLPIFHLTGTGSLLNGRVIGNAHGGGAAATTTGLSTTNFVATY